MSTRVSPVPLTDLAAGAPLHHVEAVTIVRDVALRVSRGELPGIPSAHVIRLCSSGEISVEGPIAADGSAVRRAAHLLDTLLPHVDARTMHVPGALRVIVARALGILDLPAYPSLDSFADALSRFAAEDAPRCIRELVAGRLPAPDASAERATPLAVPASGEIVDRILEITVSDIRRARRATGVRLSDISRRCQIPVRLLRELEWGYLKNWPAAHTGRRLMISYARSAGLDEELVTRAVWPLLAEAVRGREPLAVAVHESPLPPPPIVIDVSAVPRDYRGVDEGTSMSLARIEPLARPRRNHRRVVAALTIPALLAIGIAPALWEHSGAARRDASRTEASQAAVRTPDANVRASEPIDSGSPAASAAKPDRRETNERAARPAPLADVPAYSPAFSAAGSAMFYHAEAKGGTKLMRADTDSGGSVLRITSVLDDRAKNFHPRPSPDGKRIAFDSDRDGERGVYIADADGRHVRRVSGGGFAAVPSWSPDGRRLAFVRAEPGRPKVWNLWTLDVSSGLSRRLTSYRVGQPWGGSWFPDGRRIAYSHEDRLVVLDLVKGTQRIYKSPVKGRLVRTPAVSPDGSRVMFQVYRRGTWLLDVRSGAMRKVLADPTAEEYTWAPDGRRVAYHSRGAGKWGIWVLDKVGIPIVNDTEQ
jgi:hypothetical protein